MSVGDRIEDVEEGGTVDPRLSGPSIIQVTKIMLFMGIIAVH